MNRIAINKLPNPPPEDELSESETVDMRSEALLYRTEVCRSFPYLFDTESRLEWKTY